MPRRMFTARDLTPLRKVTERILQSEPDAAVVAAAATPFKRRIPKAEYEERIDVGLPVEIETSTNPQGVPLHEIAKSLQDEVPGITGVSVTPGGVSLKFEREPTPAQRSKLMSILTDKSRLEDLKPRVRPALVPPSARALTEQDLQRVLRDPEASDAGWLRAFRRYALDHLIEGPSEPPDKPRRAKE